MFIVHLAIGELRDLKITSVLIQMRCEQSSLTRLMRPLNKKRPQVFGGVFNLPKRLSHRLLKIAIDRGKEFLSCQVWSIIADQHR